MAETIEMVIDPITRVAGHIGVRVVVDTRTRRSQPESVRAFVTMFRGFEVFSMGRPPEDLPHITSRLCGVCGASHANADVIAVDMAYGVTPEPLGVVLRNLAFAMTDHVYDHPTVLTLLQAVDYSEAIVSKLTPSVYREAERTLAEHRGIHGFTTIADIMKALNPIEGRMWQLAVHFQRYAREAGVLIYGRHSHPPTLIPGGIGTDLSDAEALILGYTYRLVRLTAWAKFFYLVFEDLFRFYENLGYADNGLTYSPPRAMSVGLFEDPEEYAAIGNHVEWEDVYKGIDGAAAKRITKPGLIIDGELVTNKYTDISVSTMEHVERSFYEDWADKVRKLEWYTETDPLGNKLLWGHYDPAYHPWNKVTIPKPGVRDWAGKYTWDAHVRIVWKNGKIVPVEVGPYANLLATALQPSDFGPGNGVLKVTLPRACTDELPPAVCEEMTFEWKIPLKSTTIYRNQARAFKVLVAIHAAWVNVLKALELVKTGRVVASRPWRAPGRITRGVGFTEAPRGSVRHWIVQRGGKTLNIQIHAPTTVNASPQDKWGMGAFEQSVANSWVTEEVEPREWQGLDFVRAIRSFDPCLPCAVHIQVVSDGVNVKSLEKVIREVGCPL